MDIRVFNTHYLLMQVSLTKTFEMESSLLKAASYCSGLLVPEALLAIAISLDRNFAIVFFFPIAIVMILTPAFLSFLASSTCTFSPPLSVA